MSAEKLTKKNKSKKVKPKDIIIIEEKSPKNITLKAKTSSSSNTKKRCKNGTKKYKQLGIGCYTEQEIANHKLTKVKTGEKVKKNKKTRKSVELEIV